MNFESKEELIDQVGFFIYLQLFVTIIIWIQYFTKYSNDDYNNWKGIKRFDWSIKGLLFIFKLFV